MTPAPIPSPVTGLFDYQFHQVAIFCPAGVEKAVEHWRGLGYTNWIFDEATLKGKLLERQLSSVKVGVGPKESMFDDVYVDAETQATMAFNYDIMPMELEFLHYRGFSRWQHTQVEGREFDPFISHMSVYVDNVVWETRRLASILGQPPFHRFITQDHTNENVVGVKRFIESIFDTRDIIGFDTKLIQKVDWEYPDEAWLGQEF